MDYMYCILKKTITKNETCYLKYDDHLKNIVLNSITKNQKVSFNRNSFTILLSVLGYAKCSAYYDVKLAG